jgi:hypothetical protein
LERAICYTEPSRCPVQIAVFVRESGIDGYVCGFFTDLPEAKTHCQGAADRAFICVVVPNLSEVLRRDRTLFWRKITDCKRSITDMPAHHARYQLSKIARVAWIRARNQVVTH